MAVAYGAVPGLQAVIFDWGGTLSDFIAVEMEDMWRAAARHLAPDREDEVTALLVAVEQRSWDRIAVDQTSTTLARLLAEASAELELDVVDAVLEEAATHHLDSWTPHIRHDADAGPTLRALRERGLRIGLLSNTHWPRAFHEHFLERDGLAGLIDARLYTSEMTRTKPHADAFQAALDALGVTDAGAAVFVGDRLYDDIFGAQSAGLRAVLRPNPDVPDYQVEPDGVIKTLPDLLDFVDAWS
jgi:putative hydrolase of the HAD superfamily